MQGTGDCVEGYESQIPDSAQLKPTVLLSLALPMDQRQSCCTNQRTDSSGKNQSHHDVQNYQEGHAATTLNFGCQAREM
jgi:hypothetical protein